MVGMMIRFVGTAAAAAAIACLPVAVAHAAQDPTETLPGSYQVELDNDIVRVVRVHYDAGAKLPDHTHPAGTTIYVYLNDSDGVVFSHSSGGSRAVTRPPVQAGGIRIASGQEEHHAVENTSKVASDFLRIYLKKNSDSRRATRRIPPTEMEYRNDQVRITRTTVTTGDRTLIEAREHPVLRINVSPGMREWHVLPGHFTKWLEPGQTEQYTMSGDPKLSTQIITIEFLTKPR
jgi:hypothetical protein